MHHSWAMTEDASPAPSDERPKVDDRGESLASHDARKMLCEFGDEAHSSLKNVEVDVDRVGVGRRRPGRVPRGPPGRCAPRPADARPETRGRRSKPSPVAESPSRWVPARPRPPRWSPNTARARHPPLRSAPARRGRATRTGSGCGNCSRDSRTGRDRRRDAPISPLRHSPVRESAFASSHARYAASHFPVDRSRPLATRRRWRGDRLRRARPATGAPNPVPRETNRPLPHPAVNQRTPAPRADRREARQSSVPSPLVEVAVRRIIEPSVGVLPPAYAGGEVCGASTRRFLAGRGEDADCRRRPVQIRAVGALVARVSTIAAGRVTRVLTCWRKRVKSYVATCIPSSVKPVRPFAPVERRGVAASSLERRVRQLAEGPVPARNGAFVQAQQVEVAATAPHPGSAV